MSTWMRVMILAALPFVSWGCSSIGPATVIRDRFDYNTALSDSWKGQLLVNIVRLRYGDAPIFLDVDSVVASYEVSSKGTPSLGWTFQPYGSSAGIGGEFFSANRPTITYSPMAGKRFARSMMMPIPPSTILALVQSGYRVDVVFRYLVQSVNGIKNRFGAGATGHPADPEFYALLGKLQRLQQAGAIGLKIQKDDDKDVMSLTFGSNLSGEVLADSVEVRRILGLDQEAKEYSVAYGQLKTGDKEIAILSRSMIQTLADIASRIEVPEADIAAKQTHPNLKGEEGGASTAHVIRVHNSLQEPGNAFIAVPYNHRWFWIGNNDFASKSMFSFLMFLCNMMETGGKEAMPIITIPTR